MKIRVKIVATLIMGFAASTWFGTSYSSQNNLPEFNVALVPMSGVLPVYVGIETGIFKEEGINVKPNILRTGADMIASVVGGSNDVGMANVVSALVAVDKRVPIKIAAPLSYFKYRNNGNYDQGIYVAPGSKIKTPKDLEGKKIGTIGLKNISQLSTVAALEQNYGIQEKDVTYVAVPMSETINSILSGRVDAGLLAEPFVTEASSKGLDFIFDPNLGLKGSSDDVLMNVWVAQDKPSDEKKMLNKSFIHGLERSYEWIANNPTQAREILSKFARMPAELSAKITLPTWKGSTAEAIESLNQTKKIMLKYEYIKTNIDIPRIFLDKEK